jgi:DNA polymerase III subunit epsilon
METAKYLVIDTETTGLFDFSRPADAEGQPRLCSIAFVIAKEKGQELESEHFMVRPDGWSIEGTEAQTVNRLTDDQLRTCGVPVREVLEHYTELILDDGLIVCAFNAQFDTKVMRAELRRAGMDDLFDRTPNICLQRASVPYKDQGLKLSRGRYARLSDVCEFFGIANAMAHDALSDALATCEVLQRLIADGKLPAPAVHFAKERP